MADLALTATVTQEHPVGSPSWQNVENVNDGAAGTFATRAAYAQWGASTKTTHLIFDFGSAVGFDQVKLYPGSGAHCAPSYDVGATSRTWTLYWSDNGSTWTAIAATESAFSFAGRNGTQFDFSSVTHRYLRVTVVTHVDAGALGYIEALQISKAYVQSAGSSETPPAVPPQPVGFTINDVEFDDLVEKKVRVELNRAGEFQFSIYRGHPQATEENLARGNIVKITIPQIHSDVLVEGILQEGDFDLIKSGEEGEELLRFGGPGTLKIFERCVMDYRQYEGAVQEVFPDKGVWRFTNSAGNRTEGDIIRRIVDEFEAADRPGAPIIPNITRTFNDDHDTDFVSWSDEAFEGVWEVPIQSDGYTEITRLADSGFVIIEMAPGFEFNAWRDFGRDLTSATFATDKIRFEKGINIVDELGKSMAGHIFATRAIGKRPNGEYFRAAISGTFPYEQEMAFEANSDHLTTARRQAQAAMRLREAAQEALIFAHISPTTGNEKDWTPGADGTVKYLPGPRWSDNGQFWVGDLVTLDTGTDDFGYDNITQRVYAITLYEDIVGELAPPIVELNAPFIRDAGSSAGLSPTSGAAGGGGASGGGGTVAPTIPHVHRAAAVSYDDTETQKGVDDVQEAIELLFGLTDDDVTVGTITETSTAEVVTNDASWNNFPGLCRLDDERVLLVYRKGTDHLTNGKIVAKIGTLEPDRTSVVSWGTEFDILDDTEDLRLEDGVSIVDDRLVIAFRYYDGADNHDPSLLIADDAPEDFDEDSTWGAPIPLPDPGGTVQEYTQGRVLKLADDTYILGGGFDSGGTHTVGVWRWTGTVDDPSGATFVTVGSGANDYSEITIEELSDGTLRALLRSETNTDIDTKTSADAGATWSSVANAYDGFGNPMFRQFRSGLILSVYRDAPNGDTAWRASSDGGATWGSETILDTTGTRSEYATLLALTDSVILCAYAIDNSGGEVRTQIFNDSTTFSSSIGEPIAEAHIADTTDAHDASAVSIADAGGYYTSADAEGALQEAGADIAALQAAGSGSGASGGDHDHIIDVFNGDGTTTVFELSNEPLDAEAVYAFVGGSWTAVTISGTMNTTAAFGSAPGSGTGNVVIQYPAVAA